MNMYLNLEERRPHILQDLKQNNLYHVKKKVLLQYNVQLAEFLLILINIIESTKVFLKTNNSYYFNHIND